jgi:hypothetical protein
MIKYLIRNSLIVILCQTLTYTPVLSAGQLSLPSGDLIAPEIKQAKYIDTVKQGTDHNITVTVTDNVGVKLVTLYYRTVGTEEYMRKTMDKIANTDDYHATINSEFIKAPGFEYYVQAMDNAGNTVLYGYSFSPLAVKTVPGDKVVATTPTIPAAESSEESSNKWLWIGLGALAVGLLAAGGGGGGDTPPPPGATLTINASDPTQ